ncbi:MAG TPA: hypothetical protein VHX17_12895 [Candidatus Cybelea sp.]|jgi:sugar lactone lactonase YvrE|nr:hypothetical protein [Candidatus Cybelea sp.]
MQRHRIEQVCAVLPALALLICSACSGASQSAFSPPATANGSISPAAKKCTAGKLYVSSYRLNYVAIYCTKGRNQAPLGKITSGINGPEGAAVDAKGNLYVTNTLADTVTEYAPGTTSPSFTYSRGLGFPAGVAVDAKQNVYVTSLSPPALTVFAQTSNRAKLTISGLTFPVDVALDRKANVYVTTYTASRQSAEVVEYAPGSRHGTSLGIVTKEPGGIVLDRAGDIVTADQGLPGVLVFPPGRVQPKKTFAGNTLDPDPVCFGRNEKQVYVGDAVGNAVYVYQYPSGKLIDTITDGVDGPNGVALDPAAPL